MAKKKIVQPMAIALKALRAFEEEALEHNRQGRIAERNAALADAQELHNALVWIENGPRKAE